MNHNRGGYSGVVNLYAFNIVVRYDLPPSNECGQIIREQTTVFLDKPNFSFRFVCRKTKTAAG